jgi:hypothetical protein
MKSIDGLRRTLQVRGEVLEGSGCDGSRVVRASMERLARALLHGQAEELAVDLT